MSGEPWWKDLPRTGFGSPRMEERLAALIIAGRKRATVWSGRDENPTVPGMRWLVTVADRPVAIIETVSVGQCGFDEIDGDFAVREGEGDRSLAFWRLAHEQYFRERGEYEPGMRLWFEHFKLVEIIDHELAAAAPAHVAAEQAEGEAMVKAAAAGS